MRSPSHRPGLRAVVRSTGRSSCRRAYPAGRVRGRCGGRRAGRSGNSWGRRRGSASFLSRWSVGPARGQGRMRNGMCSVARSATRYRHRQDTTTRLGEEVTQDGSQEDEAREDAQDRRSFQGDEEVVSPLLAEDAQDAAGARDLVVGRFLKVVPRSPVGYWGLRAFGVTAPCVGHRPRRESTRCLGGGARISRRPRPGGRAAGCPRSPRAAWRSRVSAWRRRAPRAAPRRPSARAG